jgi:hypothetical protein
MDVFNTPNLNLCYATLIQVSIGQKRNRVLIGREDQVDTFPQSHRKHALGARQRLARSGRAVEGSQGRGGLELLDSAEKRARNLAESSPCLVLMAKGLLKLLVPEPDIYVAPRLPQYIHRTPIGYEFMP